MHRFSLLATVSVVAALFSVETAAAQEGPPDRERGEAATEAEIVVTARKREEGLAEVPSAVSVIDAEALENRGGATSAGDLFSGEPSVRFFDTNSSLNSEIALRGSSTARGTNADPSIGLYRNGAYIGGGRLGGRSFSRLDLFDIGRVEVLRGTQGALYGRNAVGGAINIISQRPQFETTGFVDYRHGLEPGGDQVQVVLNTPINDVFAIRFGGEYVERDEGFFYNPTNDVYFDRESGHALRGQIRMRTDRLDVNLLLEHQQMDLPAVSYQVVIAPTPPRFPLGYVQDQFSYPWSTEPFSKQQLNDAILTLNYELGWADFNSTTFVRDRDSGLAVDLDGIDAPTLAALNASGVVVGPVDVNSSSITFDRTTSWFQDAHLSGSSMLGRLDWLIGLEYLFQESESDTISGRTPTGANPSTGARAPVSTEYESAAAYGSVGYDLTDALNLTAELRYTSDTRAVMARRFDLLTGLPSGGAGFNVDADDAPDNVSSNLTAAYRLTPTILTYAKLGTSYRAGGFNTNLGDPRQPVPIPAAYGDETATVLEAGLRGDLSSNLYLALAGYRSYSEGLIVQLDNGCGATNPTCPVVATSFLTNAGEGEIWGLEFEAIYRAEFAGGAVRATLGVSRQGGEVVAGVFEGFVLPQIPDWIASAEIYYRRPFIGDAEWFGNVRYNAQWGGTQELSRLSPMIEDRQLLNLRAGVRVPNEWGSVDISAYVNNATDEVFSVFSSATTRRVSQPRSYGVQIRQRW